jgi:hypothetical protein
MTAYCHPMPHQIAEEMLQVVARAICDRPGESPAQRDSRTHQMVHSVTGLTPRDGLEYMLSSLAVGHFNLILDSLHEVFAGQTEAMKARTKSTIVALDRAFIGLIRELRTERKRPLMKWSETARPASEAEKPAEMPVEVPVEMPMEIPVKAPASDNAALVAEMALALREEAERETASAGSARVVASRNGDGTLDMLNAARHPVDTAIEQPGTASRLLSGTSLSSRIGEASAEEQLADFEKTLAVMTATLHDARAPEHANGKARVATED